MAEAKLNSLMRIAGNPVVDRPVVRRLIEDHLSWLIAHPETEQRNVTLHQLHVYEFDWIGLLGELNIPPQNHWATIRMNGGQSYTDVPQNIGILLVPATNAITKLADLQNTGKKAS